MKKLLLLTIIALSFHLNTEAQAPKITYNSPQNYIVGESITPLVPTNTGGVVLSTYWQVTTFPENGNYGAGLNSPQSIATDAAGNVYVTDTSNHMIRKITPAGVATIFAGSGKYGSSDGTGNAASFYFPEGIATDAQGNVYVADSWNNKIRKITPAGTVTTLAGNGESGAKDGIGSSASFDEPSGIAVDAAGNVYVADSGNNKIRKISSSGVVTTFAGSGNTGSADGAGNTASFYKPYGLAIDASGNVYIADQFNHKIRKLTPMGVVSTIAGSGNQGKTDGQADAASFYYPGAVSIEASGIIYVADTFNNTIRKISPEGVVRTIAGNGNMGATDGKDITASFSNPYGIATDNHGNVYVADSMNNKIRKIPTYGYNISPKLPAGLSFDNATGIISGVPATVSSAVTYMITATNPAGMSSTDIVISAKLPDLPQISYSNTSQNYKANTPIIPLVPVNSGGSSATLHYPQVSTFAEDVTSSGIALDALGNVYIADDINKIRKITPAGKVRTLAGGESGFSDGTGSNAKFDGPKGVTVDVSGNIYVADSNNKRIRKITPSGDVSTLAGNGNWGSTDGIGTVASFIFPTGIASDSYGNIFVADNGNSKIRKISPAGVVTTYASGQEVATDATRNVYVSQDTRIQKISPTAVVTTLAYTARSNSAIAADASGNVYYSDYFKIRKISPTGVLTTLAGSGDKGSTDGIAASFNGPKGLALDASGNIYVADAGNYKIRKIITNAWYIYPKLPAGLSFDNATGIISGTPTVASPSTIYTITANNAAGSNSTTVVLETAALGLQDFKNETISVYPNPTTALLQIKTPENITFDKIQVIDISGKVILEQTGNSNQINVQKLSSGIYFLNAFSENKTYRTKFIKE